MRISINLATKPFRDFGPIVRNLRITMGVLVLFSLGFWLGLHLVHAKAEKARAREHSLDGQFAKLNAEQQGYKNLMEEPDNARVLSQSQMLNQLFDEKTFSWTLAMEDLERVLPGGVQVTTLEPQRDPKSGVITVKLRVLGPRDKSIDLVRNLEHSKRFVNARIVDESVETGNNTSQKMEPVSASTKANFNLIADYNPPTEDESKTIIKTQKKSDEGTNAGMKSGPSTGAKPLQRPAFQPNAQMNQRPRTPMGAPGQGTDNQQGRPRLRPLPPQPNQPQAPSGGIQ